MRKLLKLIAVMAAAILFAAAMRAVSFLPADNKAYIEEKYAGWSGVLQACVCSRWQPGGSIVRWLNRCAADFEKQHDGVYLEFIACEETEIGGIGEIYHPDMYFFSPGVFPAQTDYSYLAPVCLGGYAWAYNTALTDENSIRAAALPDMQADTAAHCYSAATIALMGGTADAPPETEPSMDIGLPAAADNKDALQRFIAGEIPYLAVSCADIAKLKQLSDAGRGPDWKTATSNGPAFTDQVLYMMIPAGIPDDGRRDILSQFAAFLQNDKCLSYLADTGSIPVSGGNIYPPHSPYAAAEAFLSGRDVIMPPAFSEYSAADCGEIVRAFCAGEISAADAVQTIMRERSVKGR